jgi:hypothetical protein
MAIRVFYSEAMRPEERGEWGDERRKNVSVWLPSTCSPLFLCVLEDITRVPYCSASVRGKKSSALKKPGWR